MRDVKVGAECGEVSASEHVVDDEWGIRFARVTVEE